MALLNRFNGVTSLILRIKVLDSSKTDGSGLTGLTSASSGLIISTIADNEATAVAYTVAGSTIETITTLGTYAAPTATKARFKEVDSTNHKGVYEIHLADARLNVSSSKQVLVSLLGATNMAQTDFVIDLLAASDLRVIAGAALSTASAQIGVNVVNFGGSAGTFASGVPTVSTSTSSNNAIADQVWDEATSGHVTAGSYGAQLQAPDSGTAQAGAATTITLRSGASATNDYYKNAGVYVLSGTGAGQFRFITGYVGSTKVATVATWATTPDNTSVYTIIPFGAIAGATAPTASENADAVWGAAVASYTASGTFGQYINSKIVRRNTAQSGTSSSITLDASASATNDLYKYQFVTIASGTGAIQCRQITAYNGTSKAATVSPAWTTAPSSDSVFFITPFGLDAATVASIADAVWDEQRSEHIQAGSFGERVLADSVAISGDTGAADNAESFFDGTGYAGTNNVIPTVTNLTNALSVNVTQISGDATAADNLEAMLDGTGSVTLTTNLTGNITGSLSGSVGSVTGAVGSVTGAVGSVTGNVGGSVASVVGAVGSVTTVTDKTGYRLSATGVDDILDDAITEPSSVFSWGSATLRNIIGYVGAKATNKTTQTATTNTLRNRADSASIASSTVSSDGTTTVKGSDA
jgi:hypothetical protein